MGKNPHAGKIVGYCWVSLVYKYILCVNRMVCMSRASHMPAHNLLHSVTGQNKRCFYTHGNMSSLQETLSTEVFLGLGLPSWVLLRSLNGFSLGNKRLQKLDTIAYFPSSGKVTQLAEWGNHYSTVPNNSSHLFQNTTFFHCSLPTFNIISDTHY